MPKLQAKFEEIMQRFQPIIGPHNRRVAPRISAANPAFFQNGNILETMHFGQIICRCQPMTATADDNDIIMRFWFWVAPCWLPVTLPVKSTAQQA